MPPALPGSPGDSDYRKLERNTGAERGALQSLVPDKSPASGYRRIRHENGPLFDAPPSGPLSLAR